ncbi:MAG: hypothetical protein DWQ07_17505 [Chloroflexi bacterium]|nr:MAG: hypothetical protein DWQ07_17505 [Chloroflexota bacterium]
MTTHALTPKRWNPHPFLVLPILLLAILASWMMIENKHAYSRHGDDAEQAYNCFRQHGPFAIWRALNDKKEMAYHFLCQDLMSAFFDVVMRDDGRPLSAYRLNANSIQEARNYLFRKFGGTHVSWERIPEVLLEAIKPHLPAGFLGG